MPVPAGTRVGLYEIVALIGAGGMGEVYRANDTRLNRQVAIKFLSTTLADAEARRRFQREAHVASSLNHPHILRVVDCVCRDVGDGVHPDIQDPGVRWFRDPTDGQPVVAPVVVAGRRVHRLLTAGPRRPYAGEGHDTRREAIPFPELWVNYQTASPYRFVPGARALIYLKEGNLRHQNFFRVDLATGEERQISEFRSGFEIRDFDIASDGSRILFDRLRSNSDVVLMDRDTHK